jgi:hypothetical protein
MYPEKLVYSNATEDNADIPLDIIYVAVQIPPNHLYDISAKWNFNLPKLQKLIDSPHRLVVQSIIRYVTLKFKVMIIIKSRCG